MKLAGCIPIHPGFMRSERSESESQLQYQTPFLALEMLDKFMSFSLPLGCTKDHPFTCPMGTHAPPLSGLCLPPFMVVVAEHDLMKDTEMEYCEAMKKGSSMASKEATIKEVPTPESEGTRKKEKRPFPTSDEEVEPSQKKEKPSTFPTIEESHEEKLKSFYRKVMVIDETDINNKEEAMSNYIKLMAEKRKRIPKGAITNTLAYLNDKNYKGMPIQNLIALARSNAEKKNAEFKGNGK